MALHLRRGQVKTAQMVRPVLLAILVLRVQVQLQGQLEAPHQLHGQVKTDLMVRQVQPVTQEQLEPMAQLVAQEHREINPQLRFHILLLVLLVVLVVLQVLVVSQVLVVLREPPAPPAIQEQQAIQEQLAILVLMV